MRARGSDALSTLALQERLRSGAVLLNQRSMSSQALVAVSRIEVRIAVADSDRRDGQLKVSARVLGRKRKNPLFHSRISPLMLYSVHL
jgi:hypothetical protein